MKFSPEIEVARWGQRVDKANTTKAETEAEPKNARERFLNAVLSLANIPGPYLDPTVEQTNPFYAVIRSGQYELTDELTLQASIFYFDGIPSKTYENDTSFRSPENTLVYLDDVLGKPEEEVVYPIAYKLSVVKTATLDNDEPEVAHSLYVTSEAEFVGMDIGDNGDWDFFEQNSTQEERDSMINFFLIRFWINETVVDLPQPLRGERRLDLPNLNKVLEELQLTQETRLF